METKVSMGQRILTRLAQTILVVSMFVLAIVIFVPGGGEGFPLWVVVFYSFPSFWVLSLALLIGWIGGLFVSGVMLLLRKKGFSISRATYRVVYLLAFLVATAKALLGFALMLEGYVDVDIIMIAIVALAVTLSAALILRYYART